jgi:hypothetical protein
MLSSVVRQRVRAALARVRSALGLRTGPGRSHPLAHARSADPVEGPALRPVPPQGDGATILTVAQLRDW